MSFPPPGLLPDPGIKLSSPVSPALGGRFFITEPGNYLSLTLGSVPSIPPGGASGKESTCQCRRSKSNRFDPRVGKIPWRRKWQPTPVFLPGKSHPLSMGFQRVVMTEHTHTNFRSQAQEGSSHSRVPQPCATPVLGQSPGAP